MESGSVGPGRWNTRRSTQAGDFASIVDVERADQSQAAWVRRN